MVAILWTILAIVLIIWLVGFVAHIGGAFIHLLLILAVLILIYNLITGRRAA